MASDEFVSGCEHGECVPVPFRRRLREKRASRWGGGFQTGVEPGVPSWLWSMVAAGGEVLWVGGCVRVGLSFVDQRCSADGGSCRDSW